MTSYKLLWLISMLPVAAQKALLDRGERDAVLNYFAACRRFWQMGGERLDAWTAAVKKGEAPNFAANLVY